MNIQGRRSGGAPMPPSQHGEAYCLMKYASKDGVTPFGITAQDGETELFHVDWHLDRYLPQYRPAPGERIFVSITREDAEADVRAQIERYWDHPTVPMKLQWETKEAAFAALMKSALGDVDQGAPKVIFARDWEDPRPRPDQWFGLRNPDGSPKVRFA